MQQGKQAHAIHCNKHDDAELSIAHPFKHSVWLTELSARDKHVSAHTSRARGSSLRAEEVRMGGFNAEIPACISTSIPQARNTAVPFTALSQCTVPSAVVCCAEADL